jgi:hypothetical protein
MFLYETPYMYLDASKNTNKNLLEILFGNLTQIPNILPFHKIDKYKISQ